MLNSQTFGNFLEHVMTALKTHKAFTLICATVLMILLGCQKRSPDEGRSLKAAEKDVEVTSFADQVGFNVHPLPIRGEFVLPENTVSFAVIAYSKSSEGSIVFRMQDPSGRHVFADLLKGGFIHASQGTTVLLNPLIPSMPMEKGTWSYNFENTTAVKMVLRTGAVRSILPIRPIFTGTRFDSDDIEGAMTELATVLNSHGLQIALSPTLHVTDSQFRAVKPDFESPTVRRLAEFGDANVINVFFIEEILDDLNLGIAARIPGTFGIHPLNMVMVSLEQHSMMGTNDLKNENIALTTIHEIGHLVGLFHTTEKTGRKFDPLDDTPKCDEPIYEASVWTCDESQGVKNIMFWQSTSDQNQLSPSQIHIFRYSPIAR